MHHTKHILLIAVLLFVACCTTATARAQQPNNAAQPTIEVAPEPPRPLTEVTLTLQSYSFDPIRAFISWYINDKLVSEGVGLRTIKTKTGPAGSVLTVQAVAVPPSGPKSITTLVLRPAYVTVTWEAETYTPFFYKGKALASQGAAITYIALPFFVDEAGKTIDPSKLVYRWMRRHVVDQAASGVGKQRYTVVDDLRNAAISVEVSTFDKKMLADSDVAVRRVQPIGAIYALHPLLGIRYERAIGNAYTLHSEENSIIVEPYFFSVPTRSSGSLSYNWVIDGANTDARSSIILRTIGEGSGTARITLAVRHLSQVLQSARRVLNIEYGTDAKSNAPVSSEPQSTYAPF